MLVLNGFQIHTCLDFYEHFNLDDILKQKNEFVVFATANLCFTPTQKRCVEIFKEALDAQKVVCTNAQQFWLGEKNSFDESPEYKNKVNQTITECFAYFSQNNIGDPEWGRLFLLSAAAYILAGKSFEIPKKGTQEQEVKSCDFSNDAIELAPDDYKCTFNPKRHINNGEVIKTVKIQKEQDHTADAILELCSEKNNRRITIADTDVIFLNVIGDTVVSVLPNSVERNGATLYRDDNGSVLFNGASTNILTDASSFTFIAPNEYVYIKDGYLHSDNLNSLQIDDTIQSLYKFAELSFQNNCLYLLDTKGNVIHIQPGKSASFDRGKYSSLFNYFEEKGS